MLMRAPLNLYEYDRVDIYRYRELGAALAAYRNGQRQTGDIRRQMAEMRARLGQR